MSQGEQDEQGKPGDEEPGDFSYRAGFRVRSDDDFVTFSAVDNFGRDVEVVAVRRELFDHDSGGESPLLLDFTQALKSWLVRRFEEAGAASVSMETVGPEDFEKGRVN